MNTLSGYILSNVFGWKIIGEFPDVNKSIIIFAPYTSHLDVIYGKLFLKEIGIKHTIFAKSEMFFFSMNFLMKMYGSITVRGVKNKNAIVNVAQIIEDSQMLHVIISPEGTRKKVIKWNKEFYFIAKKTKIPIIVIYLDYLKKEIGIKGVINDPENINTVMNQINTMYKNVTAKYPDNFSIEL
ncbi:MAG: 1-acyl-sn-glycerol-3-phosphate acyltransferase [Paludibacter sp.]